jgi:CRP-like cAMP-binding protein
MLDGEPRSADAVAVAPCELMLLPRDVFLRFISENADAALRLLAALGAQFRRLTDTVHDAAFLDVPARIARALQSLCEASSGRDEPAVLRITQTDLAAMVGATRESVNKWLGYYQDHGWVRRERGHIVVLDRSALAEQARIV